MLPLLIPLAISLASKFAPSLIGHLMGDKAEAVAEQVIGIATNITGAADGDAAAKILSTDPAAALQFQQAANSLTISLEQEKTKQLQIQLGEVNATMRAESASSSKAQRTWRPFNGFMFPITIWCDYFAAPIALAIIKAFAAATNPVHSLVFEHVPDGVYLLWAAVLGVTAGSRGFEKVAATKSSNGGSQDLLATLKTFGQGAIGK